MKAKKIKNAVVTLLSLVMVAGLWACTTEPIERDGGTLPDKDAIETTYGMLRSSRAPKNETVIVITEGAIGSVTEDVSYLITKAALQTTTIDMHVNETLLELFNTKYGVNFVLLPTTNYEFVGDKTLSIAQGKQKSDVKQLKIHGKNLVAGEYLLPITVATNDSELQNQWQTIYYRVIIRKPQLSDSELNTDQVFMIGNIDVSIYQPLLVTDYYMTKMDFLVTFAQVWYRSMVNLVNLQRMTLDYDAATNLVRLNLGSDMRYVLDHVVKYIRPIQDQGRKVCITIEGGGKGVGFCNLSDAQIADFTSQIKYIIETYELDGVNLYDRNSGYGQQGLPSMNTTSYPKLIKALRAALGTEKILSVTDHKEPTEYFWDTTATGGIKVGEYLDYAWSGYRDGSIPIQIVDPWHHDAVSDAGEKLVYAETHKPFAGLAPSKYGCINVPWTTTHVDYNSVAFWKLGKYKQSNILVYDLRSTIQDQFESVVGAIYSSSFEAFADDGVIGFVEYDWDPGTLYSESANAYWPAGDRLENPVPPNKNQYGKWLKDW